jgi:uncharacterized repeat protein (TIGR03803 family)
MEILERRSASMKGIASALGKPSWGKRAYAVFVLCATTAIALPAQTLTTLLSFTHHAYTRAGLVQATNGDLYGTTLDSGAHGVGTIFKITPSGMPTTLYSFCSQTGCADGEYPRAGLVQGTDGDFYGTTEAGGTNCALGGCGTVFKITPGGALTVLYSFCSQSGCLDGLQPLAGLIQATNGDLYGTTYGGGAKGIGTVFKITPSGTLTMLHSFCSQSGCLDGAYPFAALIQATNGDFYGTTAAGGSNGNYGTIFKMTPGGTLTTIYSFCSQSGCLEGDSPYAGLVQAANGDFYGTTTAGGANNTGTVFKVTPSGTLTTLYSFCSQSGCPDGAIPYAGLIQATNGDFYGTTGYDGSNNGGTIFEITPGGTLTTLYSFCSQSGCTDGDFPYAGLVQDTNGDFYGTTFQGGASGDGTVFSLSVGLSPFVETQTTSGMVGAVVKILGTDLTGATGVSFNGTAAVFKVISSSLVTAAVPAGATSGTVQVVTPGGTLSSNVPFRVLP